MSVFEYKANENAFEVFLIFNYAFDENIPIDGIPVNWEVGDDFFGLLRKKSQEQERYTINYNLMRKYFLNSSKMICVLQ